MLRTVEPATHRSNGQQNEQPERWFWTKYMDNMGNANGSEGPGPNKRDDDATYGGTGNASIDWTLT